MPEPLFNLYLTGHGKPGEPIERVRERLAQQAGVSAETARRLLAGRRTQVKRGVDFAVAAHYKAMFDGIGAACELEAVESIDLDASLREPGPGLPPPARTRTGDAPRRATVPDAARTEEDEDLSPDDYFSIYFTQQKKLRQGHPTERQRRFAATRPAWLRGWMIVAAGAAIGVLFVWPVGCAG